jgi:glycosyltransferase involved in cell wall biosynthesis
MIDALSATGATEATGDERRQLDRRTGDRRATDRLTLVVPCYNEATRLDAAAFTAALATNPWLDLCFVNDGSTDHTAERLADLAAAAPARVQVLTLPENVGKAEAVRRGLQWGTTRSAYCGFWDADLAAPLTELPVLWAVFDREPAVAWVFGIRLRTLGRAIIRRPLRHYLGRVFATVTSLVLAINSYDTQCGAKLFRVTPLLRTALATPFLSRWIFDVELLLRADALLRASGGPPLDTMVSEQPLTIWRHQQGSKVRPADFLRAIMELWTVRRARQHWSRADPVLIPRV